jgi:hypothetical protein
MPQTFTGRGGIMLPGVGFPVPAGWSLGWWQAQDKPAAVQHMFDTRQLMLHQRVAQAVDPNTGKIDPDAWNSEVKAAFNDGLLTNQELQKYYGHSDIGQALIQGTLPTGEQAGTKGAAAAAESAATAPLQNETHPVTDASGTHDETHPRAWWLQNSPGSVGQPQSGAPAAPAGGGQTGGGQTGNTISGQQYADGVRGGENPGRNPYQPNASGPGGTPTSSAVGNHQFEDGTWLQEMKKWRPDLTNGQSDATILAMRGNDGLSTEMTQRYAVDNAPILTAGGLPVNAASLALAHGFGGAGAVHIANLPANTPMTVAFPPSMGPNGEEVPNQVIRSNPSYANMTTGQIITGYVGRLGTKAVDLSGVTPAGAGGGAPQGTTPTGTGVGATTPTFAQKNQVDNDNKQLAADTDDINRIQGVSHLAASAQPVLLDISRLAPISQTGSLADLKTAAGNFVATFGGQWGQQFAKDIAGIPDQSTTANTQELIKQLFKNVTSAESQMGGAGASVRVGAMLTQFFARANPSINMQGPAIQEMTNWLKVNNEMISDYAQAANQHYAAARASFNSNPVAHPYQGLNDFDSAWLDKESANAPVTYEAAALAMNHKPYNEWSKGLNPAQIAQVGGIISRADSVNGGLTNSKGQWIPSTRLAGTAAAPPPMAPAPAQP